MHARPPKLGQVRVDRIAHQRVHETHRARRWLGQQAGHDRDLETVHHPTLVGVRRLDDDLDLGVAAHDRGKPQHRDGWRGQPRQPPSEHITDALRHLGHSHERALAGEQLGALPQVERIAARPLDERRDDVRVHSAAAARANEQRGVDAGQPGQAGPASVGRARPERARAGPRQCRSVPRRAWLRRGHRERLLEQLHLLIERPTNALRRRPDGSPISADGHTHLTASTLIDCVHRDCLHVLLDLIRRRQGIRTVRHLAVVNRRRRSGWRTPRSPTQSGTGASYGR